MKITIEQKLKQGNPLLHIVYKNFYLNDEGFLYKAIGEEAIKNNKIGLLILAGGQGTRLGFNGPKGLFPLNDGLTNLYQLFINKVQNIEDKFNVKLEKYILTSDFTYEETKKYFKNKDFKILVQENIQCTDLDDNPIDAYSPNGNGGLFDAIRKVRLNCEVLNVVGVDNILCNIIDPISVGCLYKNNYEILSKSVNKNLQEKAGIFTILNGKLQIKEYNTISDSIVDDKDVLQEQANILNHYFTKTFLRNEFQLPIHKSKKMIKVDGNLVEGYKNELFIFDSFDLAKRAGVINVPRELEFSPLKNGNESENYNLKTCVQDYKKYLIIKSKMGYKTDFRGADLQ